MRSERKTAQLQLRVSRREKTAIQRAARHAGVDMSAYILERVLPASREHFNLLVSRLAEADDPAFPLAALNDFLDNLTAAELGAATAEAPRVPLPPLLRNYLAAMVELASARRGVAPPPWTRAVPPLDRPWFGSQLASLRVYLLTHSPAPFRRRNIFIDASLGDRV